MVGTLALGILDGPRLKLIDVPSELFYGLTPLNFILGFLAGYER